jgi:mannose-6-phosphate isomerase class I
LKPCKLQIVATVHGKLEVRNGSDSVNLSAGQFCLVPACLEKTEAHAKSEVTALRVEAN